MKFKILVLVMLGIAFTIGMFGCEAENPGEPTPNQPPNTYISEASPGNVTTIAFYGTDTDGYVEDYLYKWDTDNDWTSTTANSATFTDIFTSESDIKVFSVKAIDNNGEEDPVPAEISLTPSNTLPETEITAGPEFGKSAGMDVTFSFSGEDVDAGGEVVKFEYTMDDLTSWRETPAEYPHADYRGVSTGAHVFYVRAVDNLGGKDPSPAQVAFLVESGKYAPTLVNTSPLSDGGGWFAGSDLTFSWASVVAEYYGTLAEAPYSYALDDPTGYNTSAVDQMASGWTANDSYTVSPAAGAHAFYLKVRDTAGGVDTMRIRFSAAAPSFDQGVLVVCGVSPDDYGSEISDRIAASAYWGTLSVAFWDLFGTMSSPSFESLPASVDNYEGGGAAVPPTSFAKYSTVVWLGNIYNGDDAYWFASPILPYLKAGGNIIFASRYALDFLGYSVSDPLNAYIDIYPAAEGETIIEFVPVFPGLLPMTPFTRGMTGTAAYSAGYGGFLNSADDNTVTNWDGVSSYTSTSLTTTLLFAHRSSNYDGDSPFPYVRGLGFWAHPNFEFSSQSAVEFPTPGSDQAKGNFIVLMGRHYGYDIANMTANFDYMLKNMCGEQ